MALPNPNPGGQAGATVVPFPGGGSGGGSDSSGSASTVKSLMTLTKDMVNIQRNILNVLNIIDTRLEQFIGEPDEKREVKDTAGAISAGKLNWKDIIKNAGGFGNILGAALLAYVFDLDKYIRTAFAAKVLFRPLVNGVKAAFTGIGAAFKALFSSKIFLTAIKPFTTAFDDFMNGFRRVGKVIGAVKTPVAIKEFTTIFGKIGAVVGTIVKPIVSAFKSLTSFMKPIGSTFKTITSFLKPIGSIFKTISGVFGSIMSALGPFFKIAGNFLKGIPIVGQIIMALFAVFDFIKGFIGGFASKGEDDARGMLEKVFDGMVNGAVEVIRGILIIPLDLLKSGFSWLMGKLGFTELEKTLDSFSFNEMFDKFVEAYKNFFSMEPEEGYFSIVKFLVDGFNNGLDSVKKGFEGAGDTVSKAFDGIVKIATNLFSPEPEEGEFSIVKFIVDRAKKIKDTIKGFFGGGDDAGGGGGFDISSIFGFLDFEFPTVNNILAKVGTKINDVFQFIARKIHEEDLPLVGDKLTNFFADAGVKAAGAFGAESVQKFSGSGGGGMETVQLKESTTGSGGGTGAATGELSKDVAAKKEGGGTNVVDQSQKMGDTNVSTTNNSVAQSKPGARPQNAAASAFMP